MPCELQLAVMAFLPRKDLLKMAHGCSALHYIANDMIYQDVHLKNTDPYLSNTVHLLLASRCYLASKVRRAIFSTTKATPKMDVNRPEWRDELRHTTLWIPLEVLAAFRTLKEVSLVGCPFFTEGNQFFEALAGGSQNLRIPYYKPSGQLCFPSVSVMTCRLAQLEHITWYTREYDDLKVQIIPLLLSSVETLTTLSILGCPESQQLSFLRDDSLEPFPELLKLDFPNLVSFSLGHFPLYDELMRQLARFLRRHWRITNLVLKIERGATTRAWPFKSKFLPSLQSLNTDTTILSALAKVDGRCLRSLTKLVISDNCKIWDQDAIWDPITVDKFPNVRDIAFHPGKPWRYDNQPRWYIMERLQSVFPDVRSFSSNIAQNYWHGNRIPHYLSGFKKLEEAHVLRSVVIDTAIWPTVPDDEELPDEGGESDEEALPDEEDESYEDSLPDEKYESYKAALAKYENQAYDPDFDLDQQSRAGPISKYYMDSLAEACPLLSSFTVHSIGWVPDGLYN